MNQPNGRSVPWLPAVSRLCYCFPPQPRSDYMRGFMTESVIAVWASVFALEITHAQLVV